MDIKFYICKLFLIITFLNDYKYGVRAMQQNTYCDKNIHFVMKVKIKRRSLVKKGLKIEYILQDVYKVSRKFLESHRKKTTRLFWVSTTNGSACKKSLKKRKLYVVAGTIEHQRLWLSGCGSDVVMTWTGLTDTEKRNLQKNYQHNCQCNIKVDKNNIWEQNKHQPFSTPRTCGLGSHEEHCSRDTWCKCDDVECTRCSFDMSQKFLKCRKNASKN